MSFDWCREPEKGLLRPDHVFYLSVSPEVAAQRGDYGTERYEKKDFQSKVATIFEQLKDDTWTVSVCCCSLSFILCLTCAVHYLPYLYPSSFAIPVLFIVCLTCTLCCLPYLCRSLFALLVLFIVSLTCALHCLP